MNSCLPDKRYHRMVARIMLGLVVSTLFFTGVEVFAQRSMTHKYPARKNVRLQLINLSGTVEVIASQRDEIKIKAYMDSPVARFRPVPTEDGLVIDVVRDNSGRSDVGDVNFHIQVPINSTVDIETKRGQITVRDVQGEMVRARIWLSGDIELTGIRATKVMALNSMGNILFDGELVSGGMYEFKSAQGDINIRIPYNSAFSLEATAPLTRSISLGAFANSRMNFIGDGRKVMGDVGNDNRASMTITNYRGKINFIGR